MREIFNLIPTNGEVTKIQYIIFIINNHIIYKYHKLLSLCIIKK